MNWCSTVTDNQMVKQANDAGRERKKKGEREANTRATGDATSHFYTRREWTSKYTHFTGCVCSFLWYWRTFSFHHFNTHVLPARSQFQVTRDQFLPIFRLDDSPSYGPLYIRETLSSSLLSISRQMFSLLFTRSLSISRSVENAHFLLPPLSPRDTGSLAAPPTHQEKRCVTCGHRTLVSTDALEFEQKFFSFFSPLSSSLPLQAVFCLQSLLITQVTDVQLTNGYTRHTHTHRGHFNIRFQLTY